MCQDLYLITLQACPGLLGPLGMQTGAHWGGLEPDGNNWDHYGMMWGTGSNQGYNLGSEGAHFGSCRCNLGSRGPFWVLS